MGFAVLLTFFLGSLLGYVIKESCDDSSIELHDNSWSWGRSITIVTHEGKGVVSISIENTDSKTAWIHGLSVIKYYRRQGYGRQLMKLAMRKARFLDCEVVMLKAKKGEFPEHWYKRLGFVECGHDDDGLVILKKRL